jgi:hypothetical protein
VSASKPDNGTTGEIRTLPDGGLSDAMPEWLRRPPAWRELAGKETPEAARELPAPDTSVIDPRTFIDVSDLPPWLQAIAARDGERAPEAEPIADEPTPEATPMASNDPNPEQPTTEPRQVQFEPVDKKRWERKEEVTHEILGGANKTTGGMSQQTMLLIGVAVVAVIILIILFATVF